MGIAITIPLSRIPLKFNAVMAANNKSDNTNLCGHSVGKAETIASTPVVMLTGTFNR
jgi:hypothetical protein